MDPLVSTALLKPWEPLDRHTQVWRQLQVLLVEGLDVLVNGFLIAQGEVVVVNDKFGIRLTDIVTPSERMRRLSRGS